MPVGIDINLNFIIPPLLPSVNQSVATIYLEGIASIWRPAKKLPLFLALPLLTHLKKVKFQVIALIRRPKNWVIRRLRSEERRVGKECAA